MSKRKYRAVKIQDIDLNKLSAELEGGRAIVAVDVAKENFYAAIVDEKGQTHAIVKWVHPTQTRSFLALVEHLGKRAEVVMEPSGTYGDALRAGLDRAGVSQLTSVDEPGWVPNQPPCAEPPTETSICARGEGFAVTPRRMSCKMSVPPCSDEATFKLIGA